MKRTDTALPGVCVFEPVVHGDERGYFVEVYHRRAMEDLGVDCEFVQDNESRSRGGVTGFHGSKWRSASGRSAISPSER